MTRRCPGTTGFLFTDTMLSRVWKTRQDEGMVADFPNWKDTDSSIGSMSRATPMP